MKFYSENYCMSFPCVRSNVCGSCHAFYSEDPSSNPAEVYSFLCKVCVCGWVCEKNENKQIEAGIIPFLKKDPMFDIVSYIVLRSKFAMETL